MTARDFELLNLINLKTINERIMAQGDVLVFPDAARNAASSLDPNLMLALNNNGGFGGGNGWYWIIFLWMMWQSNGGRGNFNDYVTQMNGSEGRQYLAEIMNGRFDNLNTLAQIVNTGVETVKTGIFTLQNSINAVGAQVGLTSAQTQNAVAMGNAAISRQICECCCENRLAIANQTNAIQSNIAAHDANVRLQLAQNEAADQLSVCQQTNQLSSQAERNTNSILGAILSQNAMLEQKFCEIKEREMQSEINKQSDIITQLRNQISNDKQTEMFNAAFASLNDKINAIAAKQPNTVPVQYPNLVAVNQNPLYSYGTGYGWGSGVIY